MELSKGVLAFWAFLFVFLFLFWGLLVAFPCSFESSSPHSHFTLSLAQALVSFSLEIMFLVTLFLKRSII